MSYVVGRAYTTRGNQMDVAEHTGEQLKKVAGKQNQTIVRLANIDEKMAEFVNAMKEQAKALHIVENVMVTLSMRLDEVLREIEEAGPKWSAKSTCEKGMGILDNEELSDEDLKILGMRFRRLGLDDE